MFEQTQGQKDMLEYMDKELTKPKLTEAQKYAIRKAEFIKMRAYQPKAPDNSYPKEEIQEPEYIEHREQEEYFSIHHDQILEMDCDMNTY